MFQSPVALIFTLSCYLLSELYQQQASSPVTLRVSQTYSAAAGVAGYGPY